MNKNNIQRIFTIIFFITLSLVTPIAAEQLQSPTWGYSLDLPEGFVLTSRQGADNYQFEHSMIPVTVAISSYPLSRYNSAKDALNSVYDSLGAKDEMEEVVWRNTNNVIGNFSVNLGGQEYMGWAVSVVLPNKKGITLMLGYAPEENFVQYEQVIISALDSLGIDRGSFYEAGIITSYAYPREGDKTVTLNLDGISIPVTIDKSDVAASIFLLEREYAVLSLVADTPMWQEAWQRYYRMIYKDAYKRLERTSFALYNALYYKTEQEFPANPDKALAQKLLTWTQGFEYLRQVLGTDFTPLPAILEGVGSDCDSRSLLLAVLMAQMNYDTMLFVSRDYSHAFFGIDVKGSGARLEEGGISYLLGETTAPVDIGLVPQDMSEVSKWMGISGL